MPEGGGRQGVLSEGRLPHARSELADALGRMDFDTMQYIDQVGVRATACSPQVTGRLWMIPTRWAPASVEANRQFRMPIGITRSFCP